VSRPGLVLTIGPAVARRTTDAGPHSFPSSFHVLQAIVAALILGNGFVGPARFGCEAGWQSLLISALVPKLSSSHLQNRVYQPLIEQKRQAGVFDELDNLKGRVLSEKGGVGDKRA
jgi:hypothetical protein